MADYQSLSQSWIALWETFEAGERDSLTNLLSVDDAIQIRSSMELLLGFGDMGLCAILQLEDTQLFLKAGLPEPLLWKRMIFEHVMSANSEWFELYQQGMFDNMELILFENVPYDDLNTQQKSKVVKESLRMHAVSKNSFMMGALDKQIISRDNERPSHKVTLTRDLLIGIYPVTQGLYQSIVAKHESKFKAAVNPVEMVSWCDAVVFCNMLSAREGLERCYSYAEDFENTKEWAKSVSCDFDANGYRLPTEAEWEYCARGGEECIYAGSDMPETVAWYFINSNRTTHPVGQKMSNGFGLYDMSGNVCEWVWDAYGREYTETEVCDPIYDDKDAIRAVKGSSWSYSRGSMHLSLRDGISSPHRGDFIGFRLVRTVS